MFEGETFKPNSPLGQFLAILPLLDFADTGTAIDLAIAKLDKMAGDPDLEDGIDAEPDDDAKGDVAWPEWHTMGRHKGLSQIVHEDDEDDDIDAGIDDEPHDAEEDRGAEEDGEPGSWPEGWQGGGAVFDDDGHEEDHIDQRMRQPHRDRIRRTRCDYVRLGYAPYGWSEYRLREGSRRGGFVLSI